MRHVLVATQNVQRFMDACRALEARLTDDEIMGLGLVSGKPGLGKTMAMQAYHARQRRQGAVRTVLMRALSHWTVTGLLKGVLQALGETPRRYRRDLLFDRICDHLSNEPAVILIDEIDALAESRRKVAILKDIHDVTGSAILMVGEERVDGLLRRFESFYNRFNQAAVIRLKRHTEEDIALVINERCEVEVAPEVSAMIAREVGKSMRSVIDRIHAMEAFARTNKLNRIGPAEYRKIGGGRLGPRLAALTEPTPVVEGRRG